MDVMKIMVTSFKRPQACTAALSAHTPAAGLRQPTPPLETPGRSQASPGQSPVGSLLLSPGSWCTRFCLRLQESVSQSCVSSGSSEVRLMATSSKRACAMPRSAAPRAVSLRKATADLDLLMRRSNTLLSQSLWGLWVLVCTRYV